MNVPILLVQKIIVVNTLTGKVVTLGKVGTSIGLASLYLPSPFDKIIIKKIK